MQYLGRIRDWASAACRRRKHALCAAVAALPLLAFGTNTHAKAVIWRKDFFPIGVWSQPIYTFDKWKSRGINTLMKYEPYGAQDSLDAWSAAANAKGFYQIRQPRSDPAQDLRERRLLAWMHDDEPDYRKTPPKTLASRYAAMKAADRAKPVLVNLSGGNVLAASASQQVYQRYLASADWISNDFYPVSGWGRPDWIDYSRKVSDRKTPGMALSRLKTWAGRKPQFAILETSNQQLPWIPNSRGVTPDEFRAQLWHSILAGANGIIYFPMQIGNGFRFDTTPPDVVDEMIEQNARITSLAAVINSKLPSSVLWQDYSPLLEGMTRTYQGDEYYFVLNMSSQPLEDQQLRLKGPKTIRQIDVVGESRSLRRFKGHFNDDFSPYELHIYKADLPSLSAYAVPVPEPGFLMPLALASLLLRRRRRTNSAV